MSLLDKWTKKKTETVRKFLISRYGALKDLRKPIDDEITEEIDLYNDKDKYVDDKEDWQNHITVPYLYSIGQTVVARIQESFFGEDNYLKVFVEDKKLKKYEKNIKQWMQGELDVIKLRPRARDFIEDSLFKRISWLQLVPVRDDGKFRVDLDIHDYFDVWWDTKATQVEDTDIMVRKRKKFYEIADNSKYHNIDLVRKTKPPTLDTYKSDEYDAKHASGTYSEVYYDEEKNSTIDEVELLEWYGVLDISNNPKKPDYKDVILVIANNEVLVRADINNFPTYKKKLFFPIRVLRQPNTLIGKGIGQLCKIQQYELNELHSLRIDHMKTLVKLLFKYKKDSGIDFDELFVEGGNAIGYEDQKDDIDTFEVENHIRDLTGMINETVQVIQWTMGAADQVMGTSAARGVTETASGMKQIIDQAMFKFSMMANNVYFDVLEMINYYMILHIHYNSKEIILRDAELIDITDENIKNLEKSYKIDFGLKDLALRREVERSQFIQAINILLGVLQQVGGNPKELLKETMERLGMDNIEEILKPPPEDQRIIDMILPLIKANPAVIQQIIALIGQQSGAMGDQGRGGSLLANPQAAGQSRPEETAYQENAATGGGASAIGQ